MSQENKPPKFTLGTFSIAGCEPFAGLVIGNRTMALHALVPACKGLGLELTGAHSTLAFLENWDRNLAALRALAKHLTAARAGKRLWKAQAINIDQVRVHAPVHLPRQVICTGANYKKHVVEFIMVQSSDPELQNMSKQERKVWATNMMDKRARTGTPYNFARLPSTVIGPYDDLILPKTVQQPDWELELAVIISRPARYVKCQDAMDYVAGYTIVNDITARELVMRKDMKAIGADWISGKNWPTFCPMGPWLVPSEFIDDPMKLRITLKLNGRTMQNELTSDMIFDIGRQIEYLTATVQLWPGDVIATGSPRGNGIWYNRFLQDGDVMECSITGLGKQVTTCRAES